MSSFLRRGGSNLNGESRTSANVSAVVRKKKATLQRKGIYEGRVTGALACHRHMTKNIIPFARAQRSVKEVVEKFYQELDDIEEIVIIAKDRDGEWIFANSELENELEWIGSLYKFINKAILEDEEDF
jgi:hypothetical protein